MYTGPHELSDKTTIVSILIFMHEFSDKIIVVSPLVFDNGTIMHELVTKLLLCPYSFCVC
jgi:hypothetical protein